MNKRNPCLINNKSRSKDQDPPQKSTSNTDTNKINEKLSQQNKKISILIISQVHNSRIDNQQSVDITNYAIDLLNEKYKDFVFFSCYLEEFPQTLNYYEKTEKVDYILTIGANSTLKYTFFKFSQTDTPPILGFSVQGQSTLYNYTKYDIKLYLERFVHKIKRNQIQNCLQSIHKLQFVKGNITKNFTCEIQINRGKNPALVKMQLYLTNKENDQQIFICKVWGDGLVISTSFGSVTRSMVLNGPIIHKMLQSLIIIPVCPLSLKLRPIVLPIDSELTIKIEKDSRVGGTVYIDGINTGMVIQPGQRIIIRKSQFKTTMVSNLNGSYEKILFQNLQEILSWGQQFSSLDYKKTLTHRQA